MVLTLWETKTRKHFSISYSNSMSCSFRLLPFRLMLFRDVARTDTPCKSTNVCIQLGTVVTSCRSLNRMQSLTHEIGRVRKETESPVTCFEVMVMSMNFFRYHSGVSFA